MYGGSGVAVAAPDEKVCPRTLILLGSRRVAVSAIRPSVPRGMILVS